MYSQQHFKAHRDIVFRRLVVEGKYCLNTVMEIILVLHV